MAGYIDTQGTILKIGDSGSPEAFTTIPNIVDIDGPSAAATEKDATTLASTAIESRPGLVDWGSLNLEMMWDERDTVHAGMRADFNAKTVRNFQLIDAGSPTKTYSSTGWIKTLPANYSLNELVRASVEIRLTGPLTVA